MATPTKKNRWPMIAMLVAWIGTAGGGVWAVSADRERTLTRVEAVEQTTTDHEARLRAIEPKLEAIATDVRWIRNTLEREQR